MPPSPQPYPTYKPSGVAWLGDVPAHWEVVPNRVLIDLKKDVVGVRANNFTLLSLTRRGVIPRDIDNAFGKFPSSFETYQVIEHGDLVFCLFDIDETPRTVGLSRLRGMVTGAYTRFVCADVDTREFLYLLYLSIDDGKLLRPLYSGLRKIIPTSTFLRAKVALPSKPEQRAIVRYLDHVDERIRRYVSAKEKLIALLEEERQAVIHRAVTRGLDPNVPLKPSGVEWLGDVPAHWEVTALHHKYSQSLGKMLDSKRIMGDHLLPYLRNTDIQWDRINVDNLPTMDIPPSEYDRYTVRPGDLLVCEGGEVGRSALWSGELTICGFQKALHRLRPRREDVPRFMYYVLRSASNRNVFSDGHVSTIAHLTGDKLRAHRFPFPSLPEQTAIVEHLDKATANIDAAITRARRQTELLREYRTRLIADVVTGKLDVREAAANLPERAGQ